MSKSFDDVALQELFGEAQEVFFDILADLKNTTPQMISDIDQAIKRKDHNEIEHAAHTLKGVLANFCALAAKDHAFELEVMGREKSEGNFEAKVSMLKSSMVDLIAELEKFNFKN